MLQFEPGLAIWTLVTFLFLLLLLAKTVWPIILSTLDERENKIRSSIDNAEKAKLDAKKILGEHKAMLDNAKKEAAEIIKKGSDRAEKIHEEALTKAKKDAQSLIENTKIEMEREREKAFAELKNRAADLSVSVAAKIIGSSLSNEQQLERARIAIKEMELR
jgi:F-type H+-transporting ATPase subunit b